MKFCPVIMIALGGLPNTQGPRSKAECLGKGCAWWQEASHRCALLAIAEELRTMRGGRAAAPGE